MNLRITNDKRCNYIETNAMRTFIIVTSTSLMVLVLLPISIDAKLFVVLAKFDYEVCRSTVREKDTFI
jgi:hypothetical protein